MRIVHPDGTIEPQPLLDLSARSGASNKLGLYGLAFHPDFAANRQIFVAYTDLDLAATLVISRMTVLEGEPLQADVESEVPLLHIFRPSTSHDGGTIHFGRDGYLYVAVGDGGAHGDPYDVAQSRFSPLGKILRIDVDGGSVDRAYGIPPDNPFVGPDRYDNPFFGQSPAPDKKERRRRAAADTLRQRAPVLPEIWALGLRNPWSFTFDPATGDAYIVDPGDASWEEINFQPAGVVAGLNYGWDWLEGSHCYPEDRLECPRQQVGELPVAEYQHGVAGCAVIGLGVYRGEAFPSLDGIFFSGDYCSGEIRGLQRDAQGVWQFQTLLDTPLLITGSGQDAAGNLYVTAYPSAASEEAGVAGGSVWMIVAAGAQAPAAGTPVGGSLATPPSASTASASGAGVGPRVVIRAQSIEPARVDVPRDAPTSLTIANVSDVQRTCAIAEVDATVEAPPGETVSLTVTLPRGRYRMTCEGADGSRISATVFAR